VSLPEAQLIRGLVSPAALAAVRVRDLLCPPANAGPTLTLGRAHAGICPQRWQNPALEIPRPARPLPALVDLAPGWISARRDLCGPNFAKPLRTSRFPEIPRPAIPLAAASIVLNARALRVS